MRLEQFNDEHMKKFIAILLCVLVLGCATTYNPRVYTTETTYYECIDSMSIQPTKEEYSLMTLADSTDNFVYTCNDTTYTVNKCKQGYKLTKTY